jgi:hypothetical protein
MKRLILLALSVVAVLALVGCGKPPDALSKQATAALQAAEAAGAAQYAPDSWERARQAVDQMKAAIDAQAKRFSLFRSYGKAKTLATDALRLAQQALSDANAKKRQLGDEVTAAISELTTLLQSARSQVSRLPRLRGVDPAALRSELNGASRLIDQARTKLADDAFDSALETASRARAAIAKVLREIERVTGGSKSKKK